MLYTIGTSVKAILVPAGRGKWAGKQFFPFMLPNARKKKKKNQKKIKSTLGKKKSKYRYCIH